MPTPSCISGSHGPPLPHYKQLYRSSESESFFAISVLQCDSKFVSAHVTPPLLSYNWLYQARSQNDDGPFMCCPLSSYRMALAVVIYYATVCILPALSGCVEYTRRAKAFSWFTLVFGLVSLSGSGSMLVYQVSVERLRTMKCSNDDEVCSF